MKVIFSWSGASMQHAIIGALTAVKGGVSCLYPPFISYVDVVNLRVQRERARAKSKCIRWFLWSLHCSRCSYRN